MKKMILLCACAGAVVITACANDTPGKDSIEPMSASPAAEKDDEGAVLYTRDGDYIIFGHYEQDGDTSNGPEPIEWEVLEEREGGMLLISRYILETKPYNSENMDVTWEKCSLRWWLNNVFYDEAFDADEKKDIVQVKLSNPNNVCWGTKGGKDTKDYVFLLSAEEMMKYYSFDSWDDEKQLGYSQLLLTAYTQQAENNGLHTYTITQEVYDTDLAQYGYDMSCIGQKYGMWWLRSPGYISCRACMVYEYGFAGWGYERIVNNNSGGVRPAIYLSLE